ncbi:hypothetical protein [Azospirillum sp. ST 5-10]|uniref:hypothetical protein n=1 Tax=unclassified Azospirillum TaxID=2630922 RepID=UPI003F4A0D84
MTKTVAAALLGLTLFGTAACENMSTQERRALYGGGIGAAGGALIGGVTGGSAGTGALIGGAAGAATGALTDPGDIPGEDLFD